MNLCLIYLTEWVKATVEYERNFARWIAGADVPDDWPRTHPRRAPIRQKSP